MRTSLCYRTSGCNCHTAERTLKSPRADNKTRYNRTGRRRSHTLLLGHYLPGFTWLAAVADWSARVPRYLAAHRQSIGGRWLRLNVLCDGRLYSFASLPVERRRRNRGADVRVSWRHFRDAQNPPLSVFSPFPFPVPPSNFLFPASSCRFFLLRGEETACSACRLRSRLRAVSYWASSGGYVHGLFGSVTF